jgi:hypothetical protein
VSIVNISQAQSTTTESSNGRSRSVLYPCERIAILRPCLRKICRNRRSAAILLNDLLNQHDCRRWSGRDLWQDDHTAESLSENMDELFGEKTIREDLHLLKELGYIQMRQKRSTGYPFNLQREILCQPDAVNAALQLLPENGKKPNVSRSGKNAVPDGPAKNAGSGDEHPSKKAPAGAVKMPSPERQNVRVKERESQNPDKGFSGFQVLKGDEDSNPSSKPKPKAPANVESALLWVAWLIKRYGVELEPWYEFSDGHRVHGYAAAQSAESYRKVKALNEYRDSHPGFDPGPPPHYRKMEPLYPASVRAKVVDSPPPLPLGIECALEVIGLGDIHRGLALLGPDADPKEVGFAENKFRKAYAAYMRGELCPDENTKF